MQRIHFLHIFFNRRQINIKLFFLGQFISILWNLRVKIHQLWVVHILFIFINFSHFSFYVICSWSNVLSCFIFKFFIQLHDFVFLFLNINSICCVNFLDNFFFFYFLFRHNYLFANILLHLFLWFVFKLSKKHRLLY